jgi:predicted ester cyclase
MISGLLGAFPDLRLTIEDQIVAGDKVATRWIDEGTNSGAFGPVPATGRHIQISGLVLDRVVDGKVVERWELWDQMAMLQQLGLAQA